MARFVATIARTLEWPSKPHEDVEVAMLLARSRARVSGEDAAIHRLEHGRLVLMATMSPDGWCRPVQLSLPIRPRLAVLSREEEP